MLIYNTPQRTTRTHPPSMFLPAAIPHIMGDMLHAVDLGVGVTAHAVANVMFEVLPFYGGNMAEQVKNLQKALLDWYKEHKIASRLEGKLTLDRLRCASSSFPKLKAKAAASRNMVPFAVLLATKHNSGSDHDVRRLKMIEELAVFYDTLKGEGRFFSRPARDIIRRVGVSVPGLYATLTADARVQGLRAWKLVPKFHIFQHLCLYQAHLYGNPRFYWCYADEDMVGQMVEVAQSCHPATMPATALFKWLVLHFEED